MHAGQPEVRTNASRGRKSLLGAAAALAAAATLLMPGLTHAATLEVDDTATFEAGATVYTVPAAELDEAGFVVVHDGTDAEIGEVIGTSALLQAGAQTDIPVTLDRAVEDGETLWVVAHADTNANGTFDGGDVDLTVTDAATGNAALEGALAFPVLVAVEDATTTEGGEFEGTIAASGVSLISFTGTTVDGLVQAAQAEGLISIAATVDGAFVVYIVGAPEFVNANFNATFVDGLAANTPLAVAR